MITHEEHVQQLALELMHEHGLTDWHFRLDHARQRLGACHFASREITVSKHYIAQNDLADIRKTLLHEIAHALCGPGVGHGRRWKLTAERIGASTDVTHNTASMPEPKWHLECLHCHNIVAQRHRRVLKLETARCRRCGIERGQLRWVAAKN
ncbi:MAG: SprT-like domain-containing protein [Pseudomonadaceae bacterium]|nr:SprT-like domain-containing protein [Pseudomonadaceae bacterium]